MWVVKIGGSLLGDASLPQWLDLLAQLGGGRVTIVCGGGGFADEVRRVQAHWQFDDLAAHNMAVLAMAQTAQLARGLNPMLQLATNEADIRRVLHGGHTAVWQPFELMRAQPNAHTNWNVTSDSIAVELARNLNAERLVVVKSCEVDRHASLAQLSDAGVLDRRFAAIASGAAFPIAVVHKSELAWMRSLLIGEVRPTDA
jgi:5-(aminomethyl)-3-furanmethanol phosphate kinase